MGIIKQLKTQGPTYNKTPPLETMDGVLSCKARRDLMLTTPRSLLDILSRGHQHGSCGYISPVAALQKAQAGLSVKGA